MSVHLNFNFSHRVFSYDAPPNNKNCSQELEATQSVELPAQPAPKMVLTRRARMQKEASGVCVCECVCVGGGGGRIDCG